MAFNYEYPYTDAQRYNDDWLINKVKELSLDWIETSGKWTETQEAWEELKRYITDYFNNLDVQEEINEKLEAMKADGSLFNIIKPLFNEYQQAIDVLSARMDTFTALGDDATTGDAELADIRVDYTGHTWPNAGDAVRGVTGRFSSDIVNIENNMFTILKDSVTASEYFNGNYNFDFPHVINKGTKFRIKLLAKTSGWLQARTQNGNEYTGLQIENELLNVGDVKIVEGKVTNRTNRLYIYSPNQVECDIEIYIEKRTEIIVSQDGRGDYTSLDDALNNANDGQEFPVTIIVRAGTYTMRTETPDDIPYKKGWRFLSIIGEDRNNCIIRNDNGYYSPYTDDSNGLLFDSSPLRLSGNVTIENLTIISTDDNYEQFVENESRVQGVNRRQSYCIHSDFDTYENTTMLIRNCKLINNHYCCVGCGTRKDYKIQVENCELEMTLNSENTDQGVIFAHSYNLNSGYAYEGQEVVAKNNIIVNENGVKACHFYASSPDRLYVTLIGNVSKTTDTQAGFESFGDAFGVTKTELCFGNNITSMNA